MPSRSATSPSATTAPPTPPSPPEPVGRRSRSRPRAWWRRLARSVLGEAALAVGEDDEEQVPGPDGDVEEPEDLVAGPAGGQELGAGRGPDDHEGDAVPSPQPPSPPLQHPHSLVATERAVTPGRRSRRARGARREESARPAGRTRWPGPSPGTQR